MTPTSLPFACEELQLILTALQKLADAEEPECWRCGKSMSNKGLCRGEDRPHEALDESDIRTEALKLVEKISGHLVPTKPGVPTDAETVARAIVSGVPVEATSHFEATVRAGSRTLAMPVMFALRALFPETGPKPHVGLCAARGLEAQISSEKPDETLVGGLLALIALHDARLLPGYVSRLCGGQKRLAGIILEALIALRFVTESSIAFRAQRDQDWSKKF